MWKAAACETCIALRRETRRRISSPACSRAPGPPTGPFTRSPPAPRARPPCRRCPLPAAPCSPRWRSGRLASPRGSSQPAARARPPGSRSPCKSLRGAAPGPELSPGPGWQDLQEGGAWRPEPSVRNFPVPSRRQRRLRRAAASANQKAREVSPGVQAPPTHPRSPRGMRSPLATARPDAERQPRGAHYACAGTRSFAPRFGERKKLRETRELCQFRPPRHAAARGSRADSTVTAAQFYPVPRQQGPSKRLVQNCSQWGC